MLKYASALVAMVVLVGCASLDFYASEVTDRWTSQPVKATSGGASVAGVSVRLVATEYSPVVSVGNLLAPSYQGDRLERWTVEGNDGLKATVELVQSNLIFAGPVTRNVLNADSVDYTKAVQTVRITVDGVGSRSDARPVTSPPVINVAGHEVTPTYQARSGGKVADYKAWGQATGLRLAEQGQLTGYVSLLNGKALKTPPEGSPTLLTALALVSAEPHFAGTIPAQKVVPEVIDFFGLKLTTEVSHN